MQQIPHTVSDWFQIGSSVRKAVLLFSIFSLAALQISGQNASVNPDKKLLTPALQSQLYLLEEDNGSGLRTKAVYPPDQNKFQTSGATPITAGAAPPPGNDNCADGLGPAYTLFPGGGCVNGTLKASGGSGDATVEVGETFSCMSGPPTRSVWYNFTATSTEMWIANKQTSSPFVCSSNFGIRVYRYTGTCPPATGSAVGCQGYTAYSAGSIYNILNLTGLTIGATYMVQIAQNPACTRYDFCIELGIPEDCSSCNNVCGPICTFAGPTQPSVSTVTSTCTGYPYSPPLNQFDTRESCFTFTAPNDTVNMQQVVNSYCSPNTYSFTYELFDANCNSIQTGNVFSNNMITGLTPGTNYVICYELEAACTWEGLYYPYLYTTSSVLPVELLFFDAYMRDARVELFWATGTEINALEYVVEKTQNAKDFTEVTRIKAVGNSSTTINYRATDHNPYDGRSFYRLKQVDIDGEVTYSKLVAPNLSSSSERDISIFPNPSPGIAHIRYITDQSETVDVNIYGLDGSEITSRKVHFENGVNFVPFDIGHLPDGYYLVQILSDYINHHETLIISK